MNRMNDVIETGMKGACFHEVNFKDYLHNFNADIKIGMGGGKGKKDVNVKLTFRSMLKYGTDKLKTKSRASLAKSTDSDATQMITNVKPIVNRNELN